MFWDIIANRVSWQTWQPVCKTGHAQMRCSGFPKSCFDYNSEVSSGRLRLQHTLSLLLYLRLDWKEEKRGGCTQGKDWGNRESRGSEELSKSYAVPSKMCCEIPTEELLNMIYLLNQSTITVTDCVINWWKMKGKPWLGQFHAGAHNWSQIISYPLSEVRESPREWVSVWPRLSPSLLGWVLSLGSLLLLLGQLLLYAWGCLVPPPFPYGTPGPLS